MPAPSKPIRGEYEEYIDGNRDQLLQSSTLRNRPEVYSKSNVKILHLSVYCTLGRWHFPLKHSLTMRAAMRYVVLRLTC